MANKTLRITYIATITGQGGAERSFMPLAIRQQNGGHHVKLFLLRQPLSDKILNDFTGAISIRKTGVLNSIKALLELNRWISNSDIVISASEYTPTYIGRWLARLHKKPFIAEVRSQLSEIKTKFPQTHLASIHYRKIRWIRCVSQGVANDLRDSYLVPQTNIRVIHNPFDLDEIEKRSLAAIPVEHQRLFDEPMVLAIGRLTKQKRFDHAIDAILTLHQTHGISAHLGILGDGELREELEAHAASRGLTDYIHFFGFVGNPYPYLRQGRAFLLSSDYEGFGRVIVDAMAVGCPVVSTECPSGPSEIIDEGRSGLLVPVGDADAMAKAMSKIINDKEFSRKLSLGGIERAERFSINRIGEEHDSFLWETVSPEKGSP